MEPVIEPTIRWLTAAAMTVLFFGLARRNKRTGYEKPPRQPLLNELLPFMDQLEEAALNGHENQEANPRVAAVEETAVDQLVRLSLAVQTGESLPISNDIASKAEETCSEAVTVDQ